MNSALLTETDLKEWTGFQRRSDVERLLRKHNIPVIYGRDGQVCTTLDALNKTILGDKAANQGYEFE